MSTASPGGARKLKIRLIEPDPPSMHLWSYARYPRLGLPIIGAALLIMVGAVARFGRR